MTGPEIADDPRPERVKPAALKAKLAENAAQLARLQTGPEGQRGIDTAAWCDKESDEGGLGG